MEMPKIPFAESLHERELRSMEQRLLKIEDRTDELLAMAGLGLVPLLSRLLNRFVMPRLWRYQQYSTRRLRIPKKYFADAAPETLLRFAIVTPSLNQAQY